MYRCLRVELRTRGHLDDGTCEPTCYPSIAMNAVATRAKPAEPEPDGGQAGWRARRRGGMDPLPG